LLVEGARPISHNVCTASYGCRPAPHYSAPMTEELTLHDALDIAKRHWRLLVVLSLGSAGLAAAGTLGFAPRTYESRTTLLVAQSSGKNSMLSALSGSLPAELSGLALGVDGGPIDTYRAILESDRLRRLLVKEFDLQRRLREETPEATVRELDKLTTVLLDNKAGTLTVRVTIPGTPRLSRQRSWGVNDLEARTLSTAVAKAYLSRLEEYLRENTVFQAQRNREFLEQRLHEVEAELRGAENALLAYQSTEGVTALPEETATLIERHAKLQTEQTMADVEHRQAQEQLAVLRKRVKAQAKAGVLDSFPDSRVVVEEIRKRLSELEVELSAKSQSLAPSHPEVRTLTRQLEELKAQLKAELEKVYGHAEEGIVAGMIDVEVQENAAAAKLSALKQVVGASQRRLDHLPDAMMGFGRLRRTIELKQQVFALVSAEYERARISEAQEVVPFLTLDPAEVPVRKKSPSTARNTLMAFLLGGCLALFVGVLRTGAQLRNGSA